MLGPPTDEAVERAQTSPIGIVLILGITLSAALAIVVFGGAALENSQEDSRIGQAEQAMTQFDSRAAQVALGDSESQSVGMGTNGGSYTIDEDAGTLKIYHQDWNGSNSTVADEYIYGEVDDGIALGAVVYETGGTTIAYQGGGVWRKNDDGSVRMVSPPEFHYRQATLTFPIVRVEGSGSVSGNARARISQNFTAKNIYPDLENATTDRSAQYEDDDRIYSNPVQEGNMTVEIQSEYCEAWRSYFLARTEGVVTDCNENNTVTAQIVALGTQGFFDITNGGDVKVRGMEDGHSMETLRFEFKGTSSSSSDFNNFEWDMTGSDDAGNQIGLNIEAGGVGNICKDGDETSPVRTSVYFNNASDDNYAAFVIPKDHENAFEVTCDGDEQVLDVDFIDYGGNKSANYTQISGDAPDDWSGDLHSTERFDQHGAYTNTTYSAGDREELSFVVNHYFALLENGEADLAISERQQGNSGLSESSSGEMEYEGGGQVVTFLHVTENRIEVELN